MRLCYKYGEPHRQYHTLEHIDWCLNVLDDAILSTEVPIKEVGVVERALWYHDYVYIPKRHDNEEKSAEQALRDMRRLGYTAVGCPERVADYILATKHLAENKGDAQVVLDVDLSSLGASEEVFEEYSRGIRFEYNWVPEPEYRKGRAKILQSFLDRPHIYGNEYFRRKYEEQARRNLKKSVASLLAA
jgi:predicted metal-dependent HD superfamily phosphohydrolase